jgi:hypothetical protein
MIRKQIEIRTEFAFITIHASKFVIEGGYLDYTEFYTGEEIAINIRQVKNIKIKSFNGVNHGIQE